MTRFYVIEHVKGDPSCRESLQSLIADLWSGELEQPYRIWEACDDVPMRNVSEDIATEIYDTTANELIRRNRSVLSFLQEQKVAPLEVYEAAE